MDSRLRGNDLGSRGEAVVAVTVILANAGIHFDSPGSTPRPYLGDVCSNPDILAKG
jgi:hypothetical protein